MVEISRTLALLERLVAFPTVSGEGNAELIGWAAELLREAGFRLRHLPSSQPGKVGLVARAGPQAPGGVWLSAHADVVPVEGQGWTRPPFRLSREGGRVFGRGVTDMKGFLAAALAMAERAGREPLAAPLGLVISYDEEVGCRGIREMLPELAPHLQGARAVIVGEPTQMQVAIGHKGKTALRVTFRGEAGHSAEAPAIRQRDPSRGGLRGRDARASGAAGTGRARRGLWRALFHRACGADRGRAGAQHRARGGVDRDGVPPPRRNPGGGDPRPDRGGGATGGGRARRARAHRDRGDGGLSGACHAAARRRWWAGRGG
ncbi:MAG: hypothetical protein KatS3mg118_2587 [Paracoccaceae bacterium]|nr:MAG: hypothetical protein KatS3mg118_2587 [Paracoccaceae bacterium]